MNQVLTTQLTQQKILTQYVNYYDGGDSTFPKTTPLQDLIKRVNINTKTQLDTSICKDSLLKFHIGTEQYRNTTCAEKYFLLSKFEGIKGTIANPSGPTTLLFLSE